MQRRDRAAIPPAEPASPSPSAPPPRSRLRRLLNRLEIDQAVFFAIAARAWQFLAGPITVLLIATFFSPPSQGFFYTFWSLIGLQTFFELSLPQVILTVASHEWDHLALHPEGWVVGSRPHRRRLASLLRTSLRWYAGGAALFCLVITAAGLYFFAQDEASSELQWRAPWISLVVLTTLTLMLTPLITLLEGCNQIRAVYRNQFGRAVAGNLAVWSVIPLGANLWVPAVAALVRMLCELGLLFRYRRFFVQLIRRPPADAAPLDWQHEVWPFQWRIALKGVFGYFSTYFMIPIIFHYQGAIPAGRLGMTWQILNSMQEAAFAWLRTRVPRLGMLASAKQFAELDRVFYRVSKISWGMLLAGGVTLFSLLLIVERLEPRLADRLIEPLPLAVLLIGLLFGHVSFSCWTYLHAHKKVPYLVLSLVGPAATGGLMVALGKPYGVLGVALAVLLVQLLINFPVALLVWRRCRQEWHTA